MRHPTYAVRIVALLNDNPPGARFTAARLADMLDAYASDVAATLIDLRAEGVIRRERIGREVYSWAVKHPVTWKPAHPIAPHHLRRRPGASAYDMHAKGGAAALQDAEDDPIGIDRDWIIPEGCEAPRPDAPVRVYRMGRLVGSRAA